MTTLQATETWEELAGTLARPAGMQALTQAVRQAADASRPLAVLTLDVDHFKRWHDEVGDERAGEALAQLVETVNATLPAGAALAHLGSDEFFALLPDHDLAGALALAERLRTAVEERLKGFDDAQPPLTVTIGAAASPAQGAWSGADLLALADMRMTFAKRRLVPHHNLVWGGTLPSDWYLRLAIDPAQWPAA